MAGTPQQPKQQPRGRAGQGQPTKFTPATLKKLRAAFELGMSHNRACRLAGIGHQTLHNWLNDPEKGPQLTALIEEAEAAFEERMLGVIETAALSDAKNWAAAAWRLERKWPDDYGRRDRQQVEHSGQVHTVVSYENDWKAPTNSDKQGTGAA